jgi:hypothetical protein
LIAWSGTLGMVIAASATEAFRNASVTNRAMGRRRFSGVGFRVMVVSQ